VRLFDTTMRSFVPNGASYVDQLENAARRLGFGLGWGAGSDMHRAYDLALRGRARTRIGDWDRVAGLSEPEVGP